MEPRLSNAMLFNSTLSHINLSHALRPVFNTLFNITFPSRLGLHLCFQSHIFRVLFIYHVYDIRSAHLIFLDISTHTLSEEYTKYELSMKVAIRQLLQFLFVQVLFSENCF
jgi:hypothetical protein